MMRNATGTYRWGAAALTVLSVELLMGAVLLAAWWLLRTEVTGARFERPELLWLLPASTVVVVLFLIDLARKERALHRLAAATTRVRIAPGVSTARAVLRFLLWRHGLLFLLIALSGPQYGTRVEEVRSTGVDIMVALDVSSSMDCQDLRPDRMEVARRSLSRLIDRMKGDRLGLVIFAGAPYVQLPITADRSAARLFLATVGTHSVAEQGTSIGAAIRLAARSFDPESPVGKAIVVMSDGEDHEAHAVEAAREVAQAGIVVHTIGMGTAQGGPIPIMRGGRLQGFKKDKDGNTVVTRMNEAMLQQVAAAGGGTYTRATPAGDGLVALMAQLKEMEAGTSEGGYHFTAYDDQFQYPLAIGLLLVCAALCIDLRRRTPLYIAFHA